ncbi:MAG: hypothetical protein WC656_00225 [Sulfurimonas sp.]|jgi:hypothetical protein
MELKDKRILYISPKFFNYENKIKEELESLGAIVDFFDDRPANDFITKVFIRLNFKSLIQKKIDTYYESIYFYISDKKYDFIFVISPETLSYKELTKIKELQFNTEFILYMWDSFENKNSLNTINLYDKVYSFDSRDTEKYSLKFLPLFYCKDYKKSEQINNFDYDLSFIATAHSDRYKIADKIKKIIYKNQFKEYYYFYLPNIIIYFIRKIFISKYLYGKLSEFSFDSLTQSNIIEIFNNSKVILDINHPKQFGLTMRTFECLGAEKKIITTNQNIKSYDFYNPKNILVIDRENINIDMDFFEVEYQILSDELYKKYSLNSWIKNIFIKK